MNEYLSICAIFKNEGPYLAEWLAFHRLMGVDHFYLYNNNSTDGFQAVLAPWIAKRVVTLIAWPEDFAKGAQRHAYNDCLIRARGKARWLAFIDIDEYLFSPSFDSVPEALSQFESYPGIVVHWRIFGSRCESVAKEGFVTERFVHRAKRTFARNRQVKSIVNPTQALHALSGHHFAYISQHVAVNECRQPIIVRSRPKWIRRLLRKYAWLLGSAASMFDIYNGSCYKNNECPGDILRLHHYILKTQEEFEGKAARRKEQWTYAMDNRVHQSYFRYHDRNEIRDSILAEYAPALREFLTETRSP